MSTQTCIELPDGRQLFFEIRSSTKTQSVRLKMTARGGLRVTAPKRLSRRQVVDLVNTKRDWIASKLAQFDEVRHLLNDENPTCPESFNLAALGESWRVEYKQTRAKTVSARADIQGRLLVYGAVDSSERCNAAIRRWLARRAKQTLIPRLQSLANELDLTFSQSIIRNQRTRWGSCSTSGVISLNAKLLFLMPELVRYVLIHELFHTLESNHSNRFWAHLRHFEPNTSLLHGRMRDAWKQIPGWAHPVSDKYAAL